MKNRPLLPLLVESALRGYLTPKLAQDARLDLKPMLKDVTAKNWTESKAKIKLALDAAVIGKLGKDADVSDVVEVLDQLDDVKEEIAQVVAAEGPADPADPNADPNADPAAPDAAAPGADPAIQPEMPAEEPDGGDMIAKVTQFLEGKLSDEDMQALMALLKPGADPDPAAVDGFIPGAKPLPNAKPAFKKPGAPALQPQITKTAMDAAIELAKRDTELKTIARLRSISEAEKLVKPFIGELVIAQDSAEAVYKLALDSAGIDLAGVPTAAYRAMVGMLPKPGSASTVKVAMDADSFADFNKRYPGATALKLR